MKRDMDIIRQLLLRAEAAADGQLTINDALETYQVHLMIGAGLVNGHISEEITTSAPRHSYIHGVTWAGHDFLDAARDETLWKKAKQHVIKPGASFTFELVKEWLKAEIRKQFGAG
jgi:Hypothetical protein (DUF2513)